jgi:hypothetical protein
MPKNPKLTQGCINMVRVINNHISLLASLTKANEKNEVIDVRRMAYWKAVQEGRDPNVEVEKVLKEYMKRILAALHVEQVKAQDRELKMGQLEGGDKKALGG